MINPVAHLWLFQAADFAAWKQLVETPQVNSHSEYMTLLAAVQADLEQRGFIVVRVSMTVSEMVAELNHRGLANTPDHRALVIASRDRSR